MCESRRENDDLNRQQVKRLLRGAVDLEEVTGRKA